MSAVDVLDVDRRARAEATPDESRQLYVQEIFDWTDSFNENLADVAESAEGKNALGKLCDLWISYAQYEISLKQWKKAVQVFEDALKDELVSKQAKLYVSYADFCKSRNKQSNAVKAYVRGLKSELNDENYDQIWIKFGEFMNSSSPQKLSFDDLYSAVSQQVDVALQKPSEFAVDVIEGRQQAAPEPTAAAEPATPVPESTPAVVVKAEPVAPPPLPPGTRPPEAAVEPAVAPGQAPSVKLSPSDAMDVVKEGENSCSPLPEVIVQHVDTADFSDFRYPQDCKLHPHRPPSLFSSPDTEPMLSGLDALSVDDLNTLEAFLQVKGIDPNQERERDSFYERTLDVLEGLFYSQALTERHFDSWFSELVRKHTVEENNLQKTFGRGEAHKIELDRLRQKNALQVELLNIIVNRTLLIVLKEQQSILHSINFPFFDKILSVSTLGELEGPQLAAEIDAIMKQKRIVTAALSLRLKPKSASGLSRTPTSDGKKRKKTRRKLTSDDSPMPLDSAENSPSGDVESAGRPESARNSHKRSRPDGDRHNEPFSMNDSSKAHHRATHDSKYGPAATAPINKYGPGAVDVPVGAASLSKYGPGGADAPAIAPSLFEGPPTGGNNKDSTQVSKIQPSKSPATAAAVAKAGIDPASLPLLQKLAEMLKKSAKKQLVPSSAEPPANPVSS